MPEKDNKMQQNTIIFRMGEETGIVIEKTKEQFEHSLFREQYKQALSVVNAIITSKDENRDAPMSNIVAFCGDRGEGKTSALETVRGILSSKKIMKEAQAAKLYSSDKIDADSFKVLRLIDPAFFDSKHNLLELLLGQMYADICDDDRRKMEEDECSYRCDENIANRNRLMENFQKVKRSLLIINKTSDKNAYDDLEEIDDLAAGIELKNKFNDLLHCYAQYFHKERVLVSIDDLDLNTTEGYKMAEEIRKYLGSPENCVVLMAVKIEQMTEVVQSYLRKRLDREVVSNETIKEMAHRYVMKLMPESHRTWMPNGTILADSKLKIYEGNKQKEEFESVKEAVVRLIYRKTRYIFVNTRNISPIVPGNLREMRLLWATLWNLNDGEKNDENHIKNKTIFKQYFYNVWVKCLQKDDVDFVETLTNNDDLVSINKNIIAYLTKKYREILGAKSNSNANSLLDAILNPSNTMQNLSTGDVVYVISSLENLIADSEAQRLLFFIKAFYSITLYEAYDVATIDKNHLYALTDESHVSIYRYDRLYRKMNALQRVVNGAYFTYNPGDVLTKEANTLMARDIRYINPQHLKTIYQEISSTPKEAISDYEQKLNMLEFFALTTTFDAYSGEDQKESYRRSLTSPLYLIPIRPKASLVNFDVLSIFYNIINIKHTYDRWNDFYKVDDVDEQTGTVLSGDKSEEEQEVEEKDMQKKPSLFEIAQNNDESLYKKMMKACSEEWEDKEEKYALEHYLISDAAIRFIDVQLAIMDLALNNKRTHRVKNNKLNIRLLYDDIQSSKIYLYPLIEGQGRYELKFKYLRPICSFLQKVSESGFNEIYSPEALNNSASELLVNLQMYLTQIAAIIHFPAKGIEVRNQISRVLHDFYMGCGGATYWNQLLEKERIYENFGALLSLLIGNKNLKTTFMQNAEKYLKGKTTYPLF